MEYDLEWRPTAYSRGYWVSNCGDVMSLSVRGTRVLKPQIKRNGYYQVNLYSDKKMRSISVHKLVMEVFINRPHGVVIDHINFNKGDNRLCNLRYVTQKENLTHTIRAGRKEPHRGSKSPNSKLSKENVFQIHIMRGCGVGPGAIAAYFDVSSATIYDVLSGRSYKKENAELSALRLRI